MVRLEVPSVACVIGEGGSGGAVAIAVADRVLMQENAIYSVISPEGCAAILWRDAGEAKKAAAAFKPDARHCLELGVIDGIVAEPPGGAHTNHDEAASLLAERSRLLSRSSRHSILLNVDACAEAGFAHSASTSSRGRELSNPQHPQVIPVPCERCLPAAVRAQKREHGHASPVARLREYEGKRTKGATPEPFGGRPRKSEPIFVVQRHDARRLHYDSASSAAARSRAGRSPRGSRSSPASVILPCTSRTTARLRELRRRDSSRSIRRWHRRDLGSRHVRARRGQA